MDELPTGVLQSMSLVALGLCSAEHARRCCEPCDRSRRPRGRTANRNTARVTSPAPRGRQLSVDIVIQVSQPIEDLWARVSDLPSFLTIDPFHERVTLMRAGSRAGTDLALAHNAFGRRSLRFGRILRWEEGVGYAFSDLSARGGDRDFPHVFFVSVAGGCDGGPGRQADGSRLTIAIRGKWTSRWIPVWLGRLWVLAVSRDHARLLRKAL